MPHFRTIVRRAPPRSSFMLALGSLLFLSNCTGSTEGVHLGSSGGSQAPGGASGHAKKPFNASCMSSTTDGGETWTVFNGPPQVAGWQEGASITVLGPTSYLYTGQNGAFFTSDEGKNWTNPIKPGIFGRYAGSAHLAPDGNVYLGVTNTGMFVSRPGAGAPLGSAWTAIPSSPPAVTVIDDGANLIASTADGPPFWTAKITDSSSWTHLDTPTIKSGSNELAYDPVHHVVYSAQFDQGLLRMVTR